MPTIEMTGRWVERVTPPQQGRDEYLDKKVSGLGLRVSFTGTKTWFVVYRKRGDQKLYRETLQRFPAMELADAREEARRLLLDASKGLDPHSKRQEQKTDPTFGDLSEEYISNYAKLKKRSWKEDERVINIDLLPVLGHRRAADISRRDVVMLLDGLVGKTPIKANRIRSLLHKMYNVGIERDLVENNPVHLVRAPGTEKPRKRVLSKAEIRLVWDAFRKLEFLMGRMFKLRFLTAQRGGEVESMRWADLSLDEGWWTIPAEFTKRGVEHRVPLSPHAVKILRVIERNCSETEWVFQSPSRKGQHIANIQKAAQRVKAISCVDFTMHDLRRTAATFMTRECKVPKMVVSRILNHAEGGITGRHYDMYEYDDEKRDAIRKWEGVLLSIITSDGS